MMGPVKSAAWMLPLLLVTGCFHHDQQARIQPLAPPLVETPPPSQPEVTTAPEPPTVAEAEPEPEPPPLPTQEHKPRAHHKKPAPKDTPPPPTEVADNAVPAIGQLSSGDPPNLRWQTQNSIDSIERQLAGMKVSSEDQKTVEHIKEFLNQAKKALASGDVDGANTLTQKAQVLLAEVAH